MPDLDLQLFRRGWATVEAVQLTKDNLWAVYEWADSKPFYGPKTVQSQPSPITGLTIWEPTGRNKAEFGDWVYKTPGGDFKTYPDAEFRQLFRTCEGGQPMTVPTPRNPYGDLSPTKAIATMRAARFAAALELARAGDAYRQAERTGTVTQVHADRLKAAQQAWDAVKGPRQSIATRRVAA